MKKLENQIVIYEDNEKNIRFEVGVDNESVWLTQKQMSELFGKSTKTINEHIKNIYKEVELIEEATIRKSRIVQIEGSKEVGRELLAY